MKDRYTYADLYAEFEDKDKVTYKEFTDILKFFNTSLLTSCAETGICYRLPGNCGILGAFRYKNDAPEKQSLDFGYYSKTGILRKHRNTHTFGYKGFFQLNREHSLVALSPSRYVFKFIPSRPLTRYLAKCLKEKNTIHKYYNIND